MARMETIRSPSTGMTRKTSIGKRWAVITQDSEDAPADMLTFVTQEKADACCNMLAAWHQRDNSVAEVHYVERCEVVAP